jgi:type IV fimbrial biogenesis protein FimT
MLTRRARGFTLIELMVTLVLLGVLLTIAIPSFGKWVANSRVRSTAEGIQNGLRLAQSEAIRLNRQTVFGLTNTSPTPAAITAGITPAANGAYWFIQTLPLFTNDPVQFIQGGTFAKQSSMNITGPALICFNSVGRQVTNAATGLGAATCTAAASTIDVAKTGFADRPLRVQIALGGQIRMCDVAKLIATSPDGC